MLGLLCRASLSLVTKSRARLIYVI
jgi:hypothetical protein